MNPFTPDARVRLAKLLELTASNHDGEALNAVRKANALLHRQGMTWTTVITSASPSTAIQSPSRGSAQNWRAIIARCLERPGYLKPWETGFLRDLASFSRLSPKQYSCLQAIAARVLADARAS